MGSFPGIEMGGRIVCIKNIACRSVKWATETATDMADVNFRDLIGISLVLGIMVATMGTFVAYFATGTDGDPTRSLRTGGLIGGGVAVIVLVYGSWRLFEIKQDRWKSGITREDELANLRELLRPLEAHAASLPWARERAWRLDTHVRLDRGTMTIDLHDIDAEGTRKMLDVIIQNREQMGRLRIITGRGKHSSNSRPVIRPLVQERLNQVARQLDWQLIPKAGSITLRPMGERPSLGLWMRRFLVFIGPISIALALAFQDLAGSGARGQGLVFGAAAGVILTGLLASYRKRSIY